MKISVVIPSYKRPDDLNRALLALCGQERKADEILIIARDTDAPTRELANSFRDRLPVRIELVHQSGVVEAYNCGLENASGEIIVFQDDDAAAHRDWLRKIEQAFISDPTMAGIGGRDQIIRKPQCTLVLKEMVGIIRWGFRVIGNHHCGAGAARPVDVLKAVNMAFRRTAIGRIRMDQELRGTGAQVHCEMKFCLDLRAADKRLFYDPAILVDHYVADRHDEDQRNSFSPMAYENAIHNLTYALLSYLSPAGKILLLLDALFCGVGTSYFGVLQSLRYLPHDGTISFQKLAASWRGVFAGINTWRKKRDGR
jgi:glycosyltransferase involved in cell wall biosynthesis